MPRFELFRLKTRFPLQRSLFEGEPSGGERAAPSSLVRQTIEERPFSEQRKNYIWHIGNVEDLDSNALYFAIGRTTAGRFARWDESTGDFIEEEQEIAPNTPVILDHRLGVAAIAEMKKLAPTATGISRQLERVLNASETATAKGVRFEILPIQDPVSFVAQLREAYVITSFSITVSEPNPFDVQEDFHRPFENFVQATRASKGKAVVAGKDLEPSVLEELSRSAAAAGEDVTAKISPRAGEKPETRRLKGNPATIHEDELENRRARIQLLEKLRAQYQRIRHRESEQP